MNGAAEHPITRAVLDRVGDTPDPRLKQLVQALVRHLHGFVTETEPTFGEWQDAVAFLTRTGQACTPTRQEFILLSDVLGVSMLVDAVNNRQQDGATESTVLGPFHVPGAPRPPHGADISAGLPGEPLLVDVSVASARAGGTALAGASVEVWQSDQDGFYDVQRTDLEGHALRAAFTTDARGRLSFWSIVPSPYPIPDDGPVGALLAATARHPFRPAHLHFLIAAEGHATLVTHLFVDGSPYLDSDAVFGVKPSLVRPFTAEPPGTAPDGRMLDRPWRRLSHGFALKPL